VTIETRLTSVYHTHVPFQAEHYCTLISRSIIGRYTRIIHSRPWRNVYKILQVQGKTS